jgi:phage baseplate assembly protein V
MTWNDFKRLIAPLQRKIFLLLGRALLTAVNNAEGTQKIQIKVLSNETITDVERFQEYGLETYPFAGAEVMTLFLNGNRDHGIAICVHDRRYRPKDLVEGEACMYTDEDQETDGHRVHLQRGQIVEVNGKQITVNAGTSVTVNAPLATVNAPQAIVNATTQIQLNTPVLGGGPSGAGIGADASVVARDTRLLVYDVDNGTVERVSVGDPDSGGANFKVLRIPN